MSYELFIGFRHLRGARRTGFVSAITLISILGITVGVTALIIVLSVMAGFQEDIRDKILGVNAHLVVMEYGGAVSDYREVTASVKETEGVIGAAPFVYGQGMLSSAAGVVGAVVRGLEVDSASEISVLPERIIEGDLSELKRNFEESAARGELPGVAIGKELATGLGVWVGSEVNIISPNPGNTGMGNIPRMAGFRVVAIFELGMYEYDSSLAFISLENAQSFFKLGDSVSGVEVRLADIYVAEETKAEILASLEGPYWARTWMDMNRNLFSALKLEKVAMFIILTLIILVAAMNIISTLIMVVLEKRKEIAILKSIGATRGSIMKIFMIEGVAIGLVGTLLGTVLGLAGALNLEVVVGLIERVFDFKVLPPPIYYIDRLPSKVEGATVALIVAISLSISFLATLYPSWKASRLDPVEGLRYE